MPADDELRPAIVELVERVRRGWTAGGDVGAFIDVAARALEEAKLHERVSLASVVEWVAEGELPPQQLDSGFGEPPLTLHVDDGWGVELLCWAHGRTSVHEHSFAGAFTVLRGASIERRFWFTSRAPRGAPLRVGALALEDLGLLGPGAVRRLEAGEGLVHSVYHLEPPTLTLLVRMDDAAPDALQYDYWGPAVAVDPHHVDARTVRQAQLLGLLVRTRPDEPRWPAVARAMLEGADLHRTFRLLDRLVGELGGGLPPDEVLDAARERHGADAVDAMLESIDRGRWEHHVELERQRAPDEASRFLLAALLSAPDRGAVEALYRLRGADLREAVVAMSGAQDPGLALLVAHVFDRLVAGDDDAAIVEAIGSGPHVRVANRLGGSAARFVEGLRAGPLRPLFEPAR